MKRQKLILCLLIVALTLALAAPVQATCTASGHIVYQYYGSNGFSYFYVATSSSGPFSSYLYFYTQNQAIISQLSSAMSRGSWVNIAGGAATCPGTGTVRNGGSITACYVYPFD